MRRSDQEIHSWGNHRQTREGLPIRAGCSIRAWDVIETFAGLMADGEVPEHIRPDNGKEFAARAVRKWIEGVEARTLYIDSGSQWENGYVDSSDAN